jgi:hypothetical protein
MMIHIVPSPSAAATFRQALKMKQVREPVTDLSDDLSLGPLSLGSLTERTSWFDDNLPLHTGSRDWLGSSEVRFANAIRPYPNRLFWLARNSASDQAALYWYLSKFGGNGLTLAIAEAENDGTPLLSLGARNHIALGALYNECPRIPWSATRYDASHWATLVSDDALVRVVENGTLNSASNDYFDNFLLAQCPATWGKWIKVVGDTMGDVWDAGHWVGDETVIWRLRALIQDGQIECDGELPNSDHRGGTAVKIKLA